MSSLSILSSQPSSGAAALAAAAAAQALAAHVGNASGERTTEAGLASSLGVGPGHGQYGDIFIANLIMMNTIEVVCQGIMITYLKLDEQFYTKIMDIIFSSAWVLSLAWLLGIIISARLWARRALGPNSSAEITTRRGGGNGGRSAISKKTTTFSVDIFGDCHQETRKVELESLKHVNDDRMHVGRAGGGGGGGSSSTSSSVGGRTGGVAVGGEMGGSGGSGGVAVEETVALTVLSPSTARRRVQEKLWGEVSDEVGGGDGGGNINRKSHKTMKSSKFTTQSCSSTSGNSSNSNNAPGALHEAFAHNVSKESITSTYEASAEGEALRRASGALGSGGATAAKQDPWQGNNTVAVVGIGRRGESSEASEGAAAIPTIAELEIEDGDWLADIDREEEEMRQRGLANLTRHMNLGL